MIGFDLTGGEKADAPHFSILLDIGPDIAPRAAIGDKGYASNRRKSVPVFVHGTGSFSQIGASGKPGTLQCNWRARITGNRRG